MGKNNFVKYNLSHRLESIKLFGWNCQLCKGSKNVETHHKDFNRYNNHPSNWQRLCRKCHKKLHSLHKPRRYSPSGIIKSKTKLITVDQMDKEASEYFIEMYGNLTRDNSLILSREITFFYLCVIKEINFREVGKIYGLSKQRVSQLVNKGKAKIKAHILKWS